MVSNHVMSAVSDGFLYGIRFALCTTAAVLVGLQLSLLALVTYYKRAPAVDFSVTWQRNAPYQAQSVNITVL